MIGAHFREGGAPQAAAARWERPHITWDRLPLLPEPEPLGTTLHISSLAVKLPILTSIPWPQGPLPPLAITSNFHQPL